MVADLNSADATEQAKISGLAGIQKRSSVSGCERKTITYLAEIGADHAVSALFHNFFSNPVARTAGMAGAAAWTASSADRKKRAKRIKTAAAPAAGKTHIFAHM